MIRLLYHTLIFYAIFKCYKVLDAEKGTVEEISYYAAGAKVFSSYPSHYFDADVNMMEEYEKIKNNTSDFDTIKEVEFTLSNNNCEPKLYYN